MKSCSNCGYHRLHEVNRLWEGYTEWDKFQGSRCHAPEARTHAKPDKTGGVRVGNVVWICRNQWWKK